MGSDSYNSRFLPISPRTMRGHVYESITANAELPRQPTVKNVIYIATLRYVRALYHSLHEASKRPVLLDRPAGSGD